MKKIKNLLLLVLTIIITFSCTESEHQESMKEKTYFLDEDFMIIKITDSPKMWVIQRVQSLSDSIEIAEITDVQCGNDFYITKELWYNKEVGSILHFDYILKSRFIKIRNERKTYLLTGSEQSVTTVDSNNKINYIEPLVLVQEEDNIDNKEYLEDDETVNKLELERMLMELERSLQSIQDEIDILKNKIDEVDY
jgi:hypothetical protein